MKRLFCPIPLILGILLAAFLFPQCTDSEKARMEGFGNKFKIEVVSCGQIIRTYNSTGKVQSSKSRGCYFMDAATGKLVEITGEVIITQID